MGITQKDRKSFLMMVRQKEWDSEKGLDSLTSLYLQARCITATESRGSTCKSRCKERCLFATDELNILSEIVVSTKGNCRKGVCVMYVWICVPVRLLVWGPQHAERGQREATRLRWSCWRLLGSLLFVACLAPPPFLCLSLPIVMP